MCWLLLLRQQAVNCNNTILLVWLCGLLVLELVEVKVQFGFFLSIALVLVTTSADSLLFTGERKLFHLFFSRWFIQLPFISQFELNENRETELQTHLDFSLLGFQFLLNGLGNKEIPLDHTIYHYIYEAFSHCHVVAFNLSFIDCSHTFITIIFIGIIL